MKLGNMYESHEIKGKDEREIGELKCYGEERIGILKMSASSRMKQMVREKKATPVFPAIEFQDCS